MGQGVDARTALPGMERAAIDARALGQKEKW